jgi:hypothetical protein
LINVVGEGRRRSIRNAGPEGVAYWFFRLNGCLTIRGFVIHPERSGPQRTEIDIVAIRFASRRELDMADDELFTGQRRPQLFLVEVKPGGSCRFNQSWTETSVNIGHALERVGGYEEEELRAATTALFEYGGYQGADMDASLVAIADHRDEDLRQDRAHQLEWDRVLSSMFTRLTDHRNQKRHAPQWDHVGRALFDIAERHRREPQRFPREVRDTFFPGVDVHDPCGPAWAGHRWSEWCDLEKTDDGCVPAEGGIYRVRCGRDDGLVYIGAAPQRTLRSRIGSLRRSMYAVDNRGHSAGACIEACAGRNGRVEVSWFTCEGADKREILGRECDLIAAHRAIVGLSPRCQFKGSVPAASASTGTD